MNKILIIIAVVLLIVTVAVLYYTIKVQTQSSFLPQKQTEAPITPQAKEATQTGESTSSSQK